MTLELALFIAIIILQFMDYYTTKTILALGGKELNPVMRWLIERLGVEDALIFKSFVVIITAGVLAYDNVIVLGLVAAVYLAVVAHNSQELPK